MNSTYAISALSPIKHVTLIGTVSLASFLCAAAGRPVQAAHHSLDRQTSHHSRHHHAADAPSQSDSHRRHFHHRLSQDSDQGTPATHHRRHHKSQDEQATEPTPSHKHHHHHKADSDSSDTASAPSPRHHHHRKHDEDVANAGSRRDSRKADQESPRHHSRHHEDADSQTADALTKHHHHHHASDSSSQDASAPAKHHRHHHSSDTTSQEASGQSHRPSRVKARMARHMSPHEVRLAKARAEHLARLAKREDRARHLARIEDEQTPKHSHHHHDMAKLSRHERLHEEHLAQLQTRHEERLAERTTHHEAHLAHLRAAHERRLAVIEARTHAHSQKYAEQRVALASGDVTQAAYAFRGSRYVMGGTSRSGFDCSGFTRFILGRSAGVDLPRTAIEQYYSGTPVDKDDLRPGDLVFFRNTYKHGISHVGIYVGNGRFVHASSPRRGVTVDSLDEAYYINHYAGARRFMPDRADLGR